MSMELQRLKVLLNKIYAGAKKHGFISDLDYFKDDRFSVNPLWGQREYADLNTGNFEIENPFTRKIEYSGCQYYSDTSKKTHVAFGVRINMQPFANVTSHLEIIFAEGIEPLLNGLNANSMDHFIFYVIYELNGKGGKLVKTLKEDNHLIVSDMENYSWHDVVSTLKVLKGYPIGVLNIQPTHLTPKQGELKSTRNNGDKAHSYLNKPNSKYLEKPAPTGESLLATLDLLKSSNAA